MVTQHPSAPLQIALNETEREQRAIRPRLPAASIPLASGILNRVTGGDQSLQAIKRMAGIEAGAGHTQPR